MVSTIGSYAYTYDVNGNCTSVRDQSGKVITYQYDLVGNRIAKITKDSNDNTTTVNYSYNAANELTNVEGAN